MGTRPFSNIMAPLTLFNVGVLTTRLSNVNMLLHWLSRMHIYGSVGPFQLGGTKPFFYMVDQYFGNDSLEPFECKFMAPLALFTLWRYPQRGSQR